MTEIKNLFIKNKLLIIFLIMIIVSPFIIELSPPVNEQKYGNEYSTVSPYSDGCEGIFRVCDKLGFNVSRYNYSTTFLRSINKKLLVAIDGEDNSNTEEDDLSDSDSVSKIVSWVKEGNMFLLISSSRNDFLSKIKLNKLEVEMNSKYRILKLGKGKIIFYDEPKDFTNANLRKNAKEFFDILKYTKCNSIAFDEYIHGHAMNEDMWDVLPEWAKMCTYEIVIIIIMIIIMNLIRFGRPKIVEKEEIRTINEYYKAAANLYEKTSDYYNMMKEYFEYFEAGFFKKYGGYNNAIDKSYSVIVEIWKDREIDKLDILKDCIAALETSSKDEKVSREAFYQFIYKVGELRKEIGI